MASFDDAEFVRLLERLNNKSIPIRLMAANAVGRLDKTSADIFFNRLGDLFDDQEPAARRSALTALCHLGPAAARTEILAGLAKCLGDPDEEVRKRALEAVRGLGATVATPPFFGGLAELFDDERPAVRLEALAVLSTLREAAATPEIVSRLPKPLDDSDDQVRLAAVTAIERLGKASGTAEILHCLAERLQDASGEVRTTSLRAVGTLGDVAATPEILARLNALLRHADEARRKALIAVGRIGPRAATPEILARLDELLGDDQWEVKADAASAVASLGDAAATAAILLRLTTLLEDDRGAARDRAVSAFCTFGKTAANSAVIDCLAKLLDHPNPRARTAALAALRCLGEAAATQEIVARLDDVLADGHSSVRQAACRLVGQLGRAAETPELLARLTERLHDEVRDVRSAAAAAIRRWTMQVPHQVEILSRRIEQSCEGADWARHSRSVDFDAVSEEQRRVETERRRNDALLARQPVADERRLVAPAVGGGGDDEDPFRHDAGTTEPVDCSVFAPREAAPRQMILVQVFLHTPRLRQQATEDAKLYDDEAQLRGTKSLGFELPRGTRLVFELTFSGFSVADSPQELIWTGETQSVQFGVAIPEDQPLENVIGTVTVIHASVPIGHLKFKLKIVAAPTSTLPAGEKPAAPIPIGDEAKHYNVAFVSYASVDREKVLARVQMLNLLGIRCRQDILDLDPGDRWERKLYAYIDECDLFLLFWSRAARQSEWVLKEIRYALARRQGDETAPPEIRPVPLELPFVEPPEELRDLHFNDRLLFLMPAAAR